MLEIEENNHIAVRGIEIQYDVTEVIEHIDRIKYPASGEIKRFFFGVN